LPVQIEREIVISSAWRSAIPLWPLSSLKTPRTVAPRTFLRKTAVALVVGPVARGDDAAHGDLRGPLDLEPSQPALSARVDVLDH
jgi:hypothetical protein